MNTPSRVLRNSAVYEAFLSTETSSYMLESTRTFRALIGVLGCALVFQAKLAEHRAVCLGRRVNVRVLIGALTRMDCSKLTPGSDIKLISLSPDDISTLKFLDCPLACFEPVVRFLTLFGAPNFTCSSCVTRLHFVTLGWEVSLSLSLSEWRMRERTLL